MAVILGNKYQSKNRDNFRKITGLSETNEKIKPENMPRIYGGIGEVYFNGQSAAGSSTGNGGGDTGQTDPNDPNNPNQCQCVSVGSPNADKSCCVSGKDCETGQVIVIQKDGDNTMPCDTPPNPQTDPNGYVIVAYPYPSGKDGCNNIMLFSSGDIQGAFDAGVTAGGMCLVNIVNNQENETCPYINWIQVGDKINITQRQIFTPQGYVSYTEYRKFYKWNCGSWTRTGSSSASLIIETNPNSQSYKDAVNAYNKTKSKNYFIKDGKIYDACDPYGEPPIECVEMCDEDGNKYQVCGDGKITEL